MDELEGLDKVIAWAKNIYIFGLFEGETGEEAPWYLKPVSVVFIVTSVVVVHVGVRHRSVCVAVVWWWWWSPLFFFFHWDNELDSRS